jgi:SsrA-binding protein
LFKDNELYVRNLHISEYQGNGGFSIYDTRRMRKLLLKKVELRKIQRQLSEKGRTVVPYRVFFNDRGYAKMEICVAAGKKTYDKRETMKERDSKRELDRVKKQYQL